MSDERSEIEAELSFLYGEGDSDEKTWRRSSIFSEDGEISKFHRDALRQAVQTKRDEAESPPAPAAPPVLPPELAQDIPEPVEGYDDRPDVARMIKAACRIQTAVANWGKPQPDLKIGNRTEGIHVRCPFSTHEDINPSAWINTSTDLWTCGKCQEGGDQIGFYAARKYDYTQQDLRNKDVFPQVIREMAEELGLDIDPPPQAAPPPEPEPEPAPDDDPDELLPMPEPTVPPAPDNEAPTSPSDPVLAAMEPDEPSDDPEPLAQTGVPAYDYRDFDLPQGHFLREWLDHTTKNNPTVAEEFFIMAGFIALGFACGHHLQQRTPHKGLTNAALMVVIVDITGAGKTTANRLLEKLLNGGRHSKFNDDTGEGVLVFPTPGSPQALMDEFIFQDKTTLETVPIAGLMNDSEFVTLTVRSKSKGGELFKPRIIDFFDFVKETTDPEISMRDRTRTRGVAIVKDSYFSMLSTTQTATIRDQIDRQDMESGWMNRMLPAFGLPRHRDDTTFVQDSKPPIYFDSWDGTWAWCRKWGLCTVVEWAPDVAEHLMRHPYWLELISYDRMEGLAILSRLRHTACKLAFLLAVNEGALNSGRLPQIECRHFDTVLKFVKDYIQPCYGRFDAASKASETKDIKEQLLKFIHDYMLKNNRHPDRRALSQRHFWRMAPEHIQMVAMDNLIANHLLSEVVLVDGKSRSKVLIATDLDDYWGDNFKGKHGQSYIKGSFYAKR